MITNGNVQNRLGVDPWEPSQPTTLKIYNIRGQEVQTLVDIPQGAGVYRVM